MRKLKNFIFLTIFTVLLSCNGTDNYNLGIYNARQGNQEKAIEYLELASIAFLKYSDYIKSIEIKPDYPIVYANLGNAYKLKGDNEKACENWKKSLELGNRNVELRLNLNCE